MPEEWKADALSVVSKCDLLHPDATSKPNMGCHTLAMHRSFILQLWRTDYSIHITSLPKSGTWPLDLVGGKRWVPWAICIDCDGTCSSSKQEHGSNFSHFRSDTMGVTRETKQASRGVGSASKGSMMAAYWEKCMFIRNSNTDKWAGKCWLWMKCEGAAFS